MKKQNSISGAIIVIMALFTFQINLCAQTKKPVRRTTRPSANIRKPPVATVTKEYKQTGTMKRIINNV